MPYLTPNVSQFSEPLTALRTICVPQSLYYLVSGALLELTKLWNWEEFGDATTEEAASFFSGVWEQWTMSVGVSIGQIAPFLSAIPSFWLALDGSAYSQADYPELAAALPPSWLSGGNIVTPNMEGLSLVGAGTINGSGYAEGDTGGESQHTLTTPEMPQHTHGYIPPQIASVDLEVGGVPVPDVSLGPVTQTAPTGGGQPHNNMPPFLAIGWAIYAGR